MSLHRLGKNLSGGDGCTVNRFDDPDFEILDLSDASLGQLEQVGVDAVFTRREHFDLRPLLAAVPDERLSVLKGVMTGYDCRKDVAGRNGGAVHRLYQADLIFQYLRKDAFP